jgi:hypothetical protein
MIKFQYIKTDPAGFIVDQTDLQGAVYDFEIEKNVGDEQYVRSGDLKLKSPTALGCPQSLPVLKCWIAVYYNNALIEVYDGNPIESSYDYVNKLYLYRFQSLSGYIYELFESSKVQYESNSSNWLSAVQSGAIVLEEVRVKNDSGAYLTKLNVYGYSIGNMIAGLANKTAQDVKFGFVSNQVIPVSGANNLPIVFRGTSDSADFIPLSQSINNTFYQNPSDGSFYDIYFADIVSLGLNTFNAFIKIEPAIVGGYLQANVYIIPKTKKAGSSPTTKLWEQVRVLYNRYQIDAVVLNGTNFTFKAGKPYGISIEKTLPVANPDVAIESMNADLYWVAGDFTGSTYNGLPLYDILTVDGDNRPYANQGIVEPYYAELIDNGNGLEGTLIYNGEETLDEILLTSGGEVYQINRISINQDLKASIEAIQIKA